MTMTMTMTMIIAISIEMKKRWQILGEKIEKCFTNVFMNGMEERIRNDERDIARDGNGEEGRRRQRVGGSRVSRSKVYDIEDGGYEQ